MSNQDRNHIWLEGTHPVAVSDMALCRECTWATAYESTNGKWNSKTLSRAKFHVRSTGHKVEYRQTRFGLIRLPDKLEDWKDTTR